MELTDAGLLLAAGLASGMANAIAGGGSLITFPALVATGLSSKAANVTNSVAVFAGYVASVAGSRSDLVDIAGKRWGRLAALAPTAVVGATAGCVLLLATPTKAFDLVVPFLILAAAGVLAFQDRLRAVVGHPHELPPARRTLLLHAMVGFGSVYGGY